MAQCRQAIGKHSTQCIASANRLQHGVMWPLFNKRQVFDRLWEDLS